MIRVGLTGGLASGKSAVAAELEQLGALVLKADSIGHEVLQPGGAAYAATLQEFGEAVRNADGTIDRRRLAEIVFQDPDKLRRLERFVHPAVFAEQDARIGRFFEERPDGIAVIEAAILIEAGNWKRCHRIVVCICRPEQQIERAMLRGLSESEVQRRLSQQLPASAKRNVADFVIDTSGSLEWSKEQARKLFERLQEESRWR
jgi:dephospho-CoA kinase